MLRHLCRLGACSLPTRCSPRRNIEYTQKAQKFLARQKSRQLSKRTAMEAVDEQALPRYHEKQYYPVKIGEVLNQRYRVLAKLGFGAYSTVWLARDQKTFKYAAVKICVQDISDNSPILNEVKVLRHLAQCPRDSFGASYARIPDDVFEVDGPTGRHYCFAMKPQGCSLWSLQNMSPEGKVPREIVIDAVQRLLACVNWLFCDCDLIHTDITSQNVLMQLSNDSSLRRIEEDEVSNPSTPMEVGGELVYPSRKVAISLLDFTGEPVLADFGPARFAGEINDDWWMPDTHRAPEILLGLPWDAQVDVWSIGIMALELLEDKNLFLPIMDKQYVLPLALAQYISYMGPPPLWMIEQSKNPAIKTLFDEQGNWIGQPDIPSASLEDFVTSMESGEEKDRFIKFMRRILIWNPAERGQSAELFSHEWLKPE